MGDKRVPSIGILLVIIVFIPLTYLYGKDIDQMMTLKQKPGIFVTKKKKTKFYSDWSPTLSRVAQGTRVMAAISASNFVSKPCTRVIRDFVITAEYSSCVIAYV